MSVSPHQPAPACASLRGFGEVCGEGGYPLALPPPWVVAAPGRRAGGFTSEEPWSRASSAESTLAFHGAWWGDRAPQWGTRHPMALLAPLWVGGQHQVPAAAHSTNAGGGPSPTSLLWGPGQGGGPHPGQGRGSFFLSLGKIYNFCFFFLIFIFIYIDIYIYTHLVTQKEKKK